MFRWILFRILNSFGGVDVPETGGIVCGTPGLHATVFGTPGMEEC